MKWMKNRTLWQFIKFGIVGLSNTIISEVIYIVFIYFKMHYLPASFIGFTVSVVNAFYWNNKYVFQTSEQQDGSLLRVFGRTYMAYLGSYLLSAALLVFWIDLLHIAALMRLPAEWCLNQGFTKLDQIFWGKAAAAFLNLLLTVPLNFLVNKYWAFKDK
ncbi:MAG: GtrA family protein [Acetatifactor sp.]|nr:GtrA family protein [Acetatifactor sp.]